MLEVDKVVATICGKIPEGLTFEPSDINLTDYFVSTTKGDGEEVAFVSEDEQEKWTEAHPIVAKYPVDSQVVAIDSTSVTLGQLPDGLVGAVRASIIIKPAGKTGHSLERYGPYLVPVTNQNKDLIYRATYKAVYRKETNIHAPDCFKTLDRLRNLLERHIQLEVAKHYRDSLILIDGSLIGGTVADHRVVMRKIVADSASNENAIVAISKSTGLTLQQTKRNILSLLEGVHGPCYVEGIKDHITQNKERYLGDIYVAKLTPLGEPFRVDIPENTPVPHSEIFTQVAGLAGDYGYPEELRLAHMTCVLSSIEIVELQSAAIVLHGLTMKEELRTKLFPL
jgi:hypothetical protein